MIRKPEFDDPCKCGHQRYQHIAMTDSCTFCDECQTFDITLTYAIVTDAWLSHPGSVSVRVSRNVYASLIELFARHMDYTSFLLTKKLRIFNTDLLIDDDLPRHDLMFYGADGIPERTVIA